MAAYEWLWYGARTRGWSPRESVWERIQSEHLVYVREHAAPEWVEFFSNNRGDRYAWGWSDEYPTVTGKDVLTNGDYLANIFTDSQHGPLIELAAQFGAAHIESAIPGFVRSYPLPSAGCAVQALSLIASTLSDVTADTSVLRTDVLFVSDEFARAMAGREFKLAVLRAAERGFRRAGQSEIAEALWAMSR